MRKQGRIPNGCGIAFVFECAKGLKNSKQLLNATIHASLAERKTKNKVKEGKHCTAVSTLILSAANKNTRWAVTSD